MGVLSLLKGDWGIGERPDSRPEAPKGIIGVKSGEL